LTSFDRGHFGWEVHEQVDVVVLAVELDQLGLEVGAHACMISCTRTRCRSPNTLCRSFVTKIK
jgi:hypothetical protein